MPMKKAKKMKTLAENREVHFHKNSAKPKESTMSTKTKDFIQKICYRKTASIDMTRNGFIHDSKLDPVNTYVMRPLRAQMEKITVKPMKPEKEYLRSFTPQTEACKVARTILQTPPCTPKSALSYPGTRLSDNPVRKVRIQIDSNQAKAKSKKEKLR